MDLSIQAWLGDVLAELTGADSRLRSTLRSLVLQPGRLAKDWTEGRRRAYLAPSGLYLVSAGLFVLVTGLFSAGAVVPGSAGTNTRGPLVDMARGAVAGSIDVRFEDGRQQNTGMDLNALQERAARWMSVAFRWVLLLLMVPALALLTRAFLGTGADYLATHLVFALHVHAFVLFFASLTVLVCGTLARFTIPAMVGVPSIVVPIAFAWYLIAGARVLLGRSWRSTALRGALILAVYGTSLVVAVALVGVVAAGA